MLVACADTYDSLLDSVAWLQSVDDITVFVGNTNDHNYEWLELVSSTDQQGRVALDICSFSGCE